MQLNKSEDKWTINTEDKDNQLALINIIRFLDKVNEEINSTKKADLNLEFDLTTLKSANSELIAQFVILQTSLVRYNGRLKIINANLDLKSIFDVVMLDKIINIKYLGQPDTGDNDDLSDE